MAYVPAGLQCLVNSATNSVWLLRQTDAKASIVATGYISDAGTAGSGKGAAGRGVKIGDIVMYQQVDAVATPTSISDMGIYYVSAVSATTGAGTIVAMGAD